MWIFYRRISLLKSVDRWYCGAIINSFDSPWIRQVLILLYSYRHLFIYLLCYHSYSLLFLSVHSWIVIRPAVEYIWFSMTYSVSIFRVLAQHVSFNLFFTHLTVRIAELSIYINYLCDVMVTIVRNGHGEQISNPERSWLNFT